MKFCGAILVVFILGLTPAFAQIVKIRAGEHQGFSRLVFNLPNRTEWSIDDFGDGFILRFDETALVLDTSTVFAKLDKNRITTVKTAKSSSSVYVEFACVCRIETFWHGRSRLVVDVIDIETTEAAHFVPSRNPNHSLDINPITVPGIRLPAKRTSRTARLFETTMGFDETAVSQNQSASQNEERVAAISKINKELLQSLARAATQGLLTAKTAWKVEKQQKDNTVEPTDGREPNENQEDRSKHLNPADSLSVKAITSIDRDFLAGLEILGSKETISECLAQDRVDVGSWVDDVSFSQRIGPLRIELTNELDRPNMKATESLVRSYLYFGFGLEALSVQANASFSEDDRAIYATIAAIMDGDPVPVPSIFQNQLTCDGAAALWAALSRPSLSSDLDANLDAILFSFSELPRHLRAHLGPTLSGLFLNAGFVEESAHVLRILERVEETKNPEEMLAKAEHFAATGEAELATEHFETVVESDSRPSASALVKMIEVMLERDEVIPRDIADLAGAYAYERQYHDLGPAITRVHILALASSGDFAAAFQVLEATEQLPTSSANGIRAELAEFLASNGDQFETLRFAVSGQLGEVQNLTPATAYGIAKTLKTMRFYEAALPYLNRSFPKTLQRNARLLRSEISLAQDNPRSAEAALLGLDGQDVNILRARAKSMLGHHDQAVALYQSAGMASAALREAWLAKEWDRLPEESGVFGAVANLYDGPEPPVDEGQLAQSSALIDTASNSRTAIEAMLSAVPRMQETKP